MNSKTLSLLILVNLAWVLLFSCATGKEYHTTAVYKNSPFPATPVYLRAVRLEPPHNMHDYEILLPKVVTAMLTTHGIRVTADEKEATLSLEVLLQRKEYQKGYEQYESLTLSLTIYEGSQPLFFLFHTEELTSSLDSVPLLCSILDKNIAQLSKILLTRNTGEKQKG
ncbi:MAG: hypothetical protein JW760_04900 [Spirochaetales bacterium]|nr:hypothetical protein [Spirochaetales bacterium]